MKLYFILTACLCCSLLADAQNIGIGTPNPTRAKLEVHGAVDYTAAIFGGDNKGISLQRDNPGIGFNTYYNGGHRYLGNGHGANQFLDAATGNMAISLFSFGLNGNLVTYSRRALFLGGNGRVVFGMTPFSGGTLNVGRNTNADATAYFFGTTHHSAFSFSPLEHTYIRAGKDGGTVFINEIPHGKVALSGPVGIGTATPRAPLEIRMDANERGLLLIEPFGFKNWELSVPSSTPHLYLSYNGVAKSYFKYSDGSHHTLSDRRIKKDIQPLSQILPKIARLQPVIYEMVHSNPQQKKTIGFLAQDVYKLFPQLVNVQQDTVKGYKDIRDLHTMNYRGFGVLAIQAIKEQDELIKAQAATIRELEAELEALETTLFTNSSKK
jgi:hypothetical protein